MANSELRIASINAQSLYTAGSHPQRGPRTLPHYNAKVSAIADALRRVVTNVPHVIGLSEVGTRSSGTNVGTLISAGRYDEVWAGPIGTGIARADTGLLLLFDRDKLRRTTTPLEIGQYYHEPRPYWLATEFTINDGDGRPFWIVLNHWPSDYSVGYWRANDLRCETGEKLGEFLHHRAFHTSDAILLIGDFNCEPFEDPITGENGTNTKRIVGVREHQWVTNDRNELPYFYNPMWTKLGEPVPWESASLAGHNRLAHPPGTILPSVQRRFGWVTWDQILVNRRLMTGGPASLCERSVRLVRAVPDGSDHSAIGVSLNYNI